MKTLLVEFKLADSWEDYIPDDEEKLKNLLSRGQVTSGVEYRVIKGWQQKDDQYSEMLEALKLVYKDLTYKVRCQDGLTLRESEYNAVIGLILKDIES